MSTDEGESISEYERIEQTQEENSQAQEENSQVDIHNPYEILEEFMRECEGVLMGITSPGLLPTRLNLTNMKRCLM